MAVVQTNIYTGRKSIPQPYDATVIEVAIDVDFGAIAPANGDLILLAKIPPNVQIVDYSLVFPQVESGATMNVAIGEANLALTDLGVTYDAALTPGRTATGNVVRPVSAAAANADRTGARVLAMKITGAFATYSGSGKVGTVFVKLRN